MFRTAVRAFIAVLLLASAVSAEIIDPVFVRGNKNADGGFDHLGAFESASDMVKYQNQFWTQAMANPNYDNSAFFDGTNYYWVDSTSSPFYLHNYGPDLYSLMNDSGADTQTFNSHRFDGSWFADSKGAIYNVFRNAEAEDYSPYANTIRQYASIVDVLANQGTTYSCPAYSLHDSFLSLNGKFYRIDTDGSDVTGITEYDSFADLLTGNWSAKQDGGFGSSHDLFMIVPRAALGLTGSPSPVPEIDPAGIGSVLALIGGGLGLLERRRRRA